ncbi:hypothetical protein GGR50DRAFT_469580 [Xylaria sp. CBS 124048]|nr:hypothetical protein GGR50DRAFT_469580 [Xylaria sp. CBS 124048]
MIHHDPSPISLSSVWLGQAISAVCLFLLQGLHADAFQHCSLHTCLLLQTQLSFKTVEAQNRRGQSCQSLRKDYAPTAYTSLVSSGTFHASMLPHFDC